MFFEIYRTSAYLTKFEHTSKPHQRAFEHQYTVLKKQRISDENGKPIAQVEIRSMRCWAIEVIDIADLMHILYDSKEPIIVHEQREAGYGSGLPMLEIYDDYRE